MYLSNLDTQQRAALSQAHTASKHPQRVSRNLDVTARRSGYLKKHTVGMSEVARKEQYCLYYLRISIVKKGWWVSKVTYRDNLLLHICILKLVVYGLTGSCNKAFLREPREPRQSGIRKVAEPAITASTTPGLTSFLSRLCASLCRLICACFMIAAPADENLGGDLHDGVQSWSEACVPCVMRRESLEGGSVVLGGGRVGECRKASC